MSDAFDTTLAERIAARSPVAYYKLDEASGTTAADSSGNGNDGTYDAGLTLAQPPLAWSEDESRAVSFPSSSHTGVQAAGVGLHAASAVSIFAIANIPEGNITDYAPIARYGTGSQDGLALRHTQNGTLQLINVARNGASEIHTVETPIAPYQGRTVAFLGVWTGTDLNLYINGELVGTTPAPGSYQDQGQTFFIGNDAQYSVRSLEATIDEVAVFDKALTAADAYALAERVVQKTYRDTVLALSPSADLGMNDASGPPVDSQGLVTLTGDATEHALTGLADGAVRYAGTDYSAGSLDMSAWDGVTLHAQCKVNTHGSGSTDVILGVGNANYAFRIEGAGGSTYRVIMGSPNTIVEFTLAEDEDISVTATHDDAGNIEAFVNGQSVGTETGAQSITVNGKLTLHATPWNESAADTQDVTIDEAQVFNRVLTPAQISALHYRGTTAAEALQLAGTAMKAGVPVARLIRAHRQSDGSLIGETTSSAADGSWAIPLATEEHCYVVAHGDGDEQDLVVGGIYDAPDPLPVTNGLVQHLDAQQEEYNDGDEAATWADRSSNSNSMASGAANGDPIFDVDGLNGRPAFDFRQGDGNARWFEIANLAAEFSGAGEAFIVAAHDSALAASGDNSQLLQYSSTGDSTLRPTWLHTNGTTYYNTFTGARDQTPSGALDRDVVQIVGFRHDGSTLTMEAWQGGSSVITASHGRVFNLSDAVHYIGRSGYDIQPSYWGGWVGEFILYDRVLTTQERADVIAYLEARWGMTG